MTRAADDQPLKKIIEDMFKERKLENKYLETRVPIIWESAVGKYIADRTTKMYVRNGTLCVYLSSAPLKQEMMHNKQKVVDLVNEKLESDHIKALEIR